MAVRDFLLTARFEPARTAGCPTDLPIGEQNAPGASAPAGPAQGAVARPRSADYTNGRSQVSIEPGARADIEYEKNRTMDSTPTERTPDFLPAGSTTIEEFERLDMRVGRIVAAEPFPEARRPAYRLTIDFGPAGQRRSSAQLPATYPRPEALVGRLVVAVVNFPVRRIAGFDSEVLVLGALPADGRIPLLSVDEGARPGDRIG